MADKGLKYPSGAWGEWRLGRKVASQRAPKQRSLRDKLNKAEREAHYRMFPDPGDAAAALAHLERLYPKARTPADLRRFRSWHARYRSLFGGEIPDFDLLEYLR